MDEGGKFFVGGEAQGDELRGGELMDVIAVWSGDQGGEAEAFFEADDAVLGLEGAVAGDPGHHEEDDGHCDPPEMGVLVGGPVVDGDVDGEDEVEEQHGQNEEVKGRMEAGVILEVLGGWHVDPFDVAGRGQHNTLTAGV